MKCRTTGNRDDETARRQPAGRQRIRKNARIGVSDFIVVVFQKRTPAAYGARHHARPCDRLKNNSPQTAGDAFGTDPTVGHRTKLIINYGKNDLPTRKKMRCTPPTAAPAPRQSGQSDHRQPLAPAARQNPEPGFFRFAAGWSPADTCRMAATGTQGLPQPPATTSGAPARAQRPSGDSNHRATAAATVPAPPRSGQADGCSPRRGPGRRAGRSVPA